MTSDEQIRALRAEIDELKQAVFGRSKQRRPGSPVFSIRCSPELRAFVKHVAESRGVTIASLMSEALAIVVNASSAYLPTKAIPQNRLKPYHYADARTNTAERDQLTAREDAAKRAVFHTMQGRQARREMDAVLVPAPVHQGMLKEPASRLPGIGR